MYNTKSLLINDINERSNVIIMIYVSIVRGVFCIMIVKTNVRDILIIDYKHIMHIFQHKVNLIDEDLYIELKLVPTGISKDKYIYK